MPHANIPDIIACLCSLEVCFVYNLVAIPESILFRYKAQFIFVKREIFHLAMAFYRVYFDNDSLVVSSDVSSGGAHGGPALTTVLVINSI